MSDLPLGRPLRRVTYHNLPNMWWARVPGLHVIDYGLDLDLDGETWGIDWLEPQGALHVARHSVLDHLRSGLESVDVTSVHPWSDAAGDVITAVDTSGPSLIRVSWQRAAPIVLVAGNYIDPIEQILVNGDSLIVLVDPSFTERLEWAGPWSEPRWSDGSKVS